MSDQHKNKEDNTPPLHDNEQEKAAPATELFSDSESNILNSKSKLNDPDSDLNSPDSPEVTVQPPPAIPRLPSRKERVFELPPVNGEIEGGGAEQLPPEKPSGSLTNTARLLRVKPETLGQSWRNLKRNRGKLVQSKTWKELATEVPCRVKISLVLIVVLIVAALWGYNALSPALPPALKVALPEKPQAEAASQDSPAPPDVAETPASLISTEDVAPLSATVTGAPTATPSPGPTPLFVFHTVATSETLIAIAARYHVTTEAMLVANNIRNPLDLYKGQHLLIPSENEFSRQKIVIHEAVEAETLLTIASKYGSSVVAIHTANPHLTGDSLAEGETVAVPIVFEKDNPALGGVDNGETVYHTIQPGDIPLTIAAEYDIPVEILLKTNNITDARRLQVGQHLAIPPHDGLSMSFPVILYELTGNDTLVGIASRFGSSVKDILAVNPDLDPAALEAGQSVAIPVIFTPRKTFEPNTLVTPTPVPPPPQAPVLAQQMFDGVNAERADKKLPPFLLDNNLSAVALGHAQDMVVRDFVAHINPDGQSPRDRMLEYGINNFLRAGENIQLNARTEETTVASAIDWFMNSPPHRAAILNRFYNQVGVAAVRGPGIWYTYVIVFAQR